MWGMNVWTQNQKLTRNLTRLGTNKNNVWTHKIKGILYFYLVNQRTFGYTYTRHIIYISDILIYCSILYLQMKSADSIPIFTTVDNLSLLNNTKHVFADSIFSYAPKHFLQMYTIMYT
jgi:hypothetical protein